MRGAALALLAGIAATAAAPGAMAEAAAAAPEEVVVIGVPGSGGLPAAQLPGSIQVLDAAALRAPGTATLGEALERRLPGSASFDALGNPLQAGLTLRGFNGSPTLGEAQGVVVYQGAMRANEAFGDVVQWDLLPVFAIARVQVTSGSNPVYGLNSIGGAAVLDMKSGFDAAGASAEVAGGSFGRRSATLEYGVHGSALGFYAGADLLEDGGWRDHSPGRIRRGYADLAWRSARVDAGLGLGAAHSELTGNGPAPEDLLARRRAAVFTYPDRTDSRALAAVARLAFRPRAGVTLGGGGYLRRFERSTANGDLAEFSWCDAFTAQLPGFTPPPNAQCFGATPGEAGVEGDPVVLVDDHGGAITALDAPIDAVFNATDTRTLASGASAQLTWLRGAAGRHDAFIAGASVDAADTRYRSGTEVAALQADRGVTGLGIDIGNPEFNVGLRSRSRVAGLYASATLSPAPALHLTAALRWNAARLRLRDQLGTALDGTHHYSRLNATAGFVWTAAPALDAYASYATNSRVPSPAELSCADPARACRFPNAFLADPPLRDVRVQTVEAGVRGHAGIAGTRLEYSAAAFVTRARDDIVFIAAGPITGSGYFDNVDASRRRGLEASVDARGQRFAAYAAYAFIDATFGATLAILAPDNPGADADGLVHVRPGNRMPSIPRHTFKAGIRYAATARLTLGTGMVATSNRYLRGDEANLGRPIGGHLTLDASAVVNAGGIEWYARVENLGNARYASFGLYGDPTAAGLQSPRFLSPGAPRTFLVGLRIRR